MHVHGKNINGNRSSIWTCEIMFIKFCFINLGKIVHVHPNDDFFNIQISEYYHISNCALWMPCNIILLINNSTYLLKFINHIWQNVPILSLQKMKNNNKLL